MYACIHVNVYVNTYMDIYIYTRRSRFRAKWQTPSLR